LISSQKRAKLVDFGLADVRSQVKEDENITIDRTVDYAGLEMATNVPPGDTRSDIFFLGCIACQMFTGHFPLEWTRNAKQRMSKERFINLKPIRREEVHGFSSIARLVENMMSLNAAQRFQTPSQLLEAVREVRREVEGKEKTQKDSNGPHTIFIAEKDERLQDLFREKFKEKGYRVLLAADPARALDRFRQQPYDVLIVNAGTTAESGLHVFERILKDAHKEGLSCHGILMLNEDQLAWQEKISARPNQIVMVQPIKFKQILHKVQELLGRPVA
jgi:serine/threonine protein kinase